MVTFFVRLLANRHGSFVAVMFALGLALLQPGAPVAFGCGVCTVTSDLFQVSHPKSLEIAMATRRAIDQGILPPSFGDVRQHRPGRGLLAAQMPSAAHLVDAWIQEQVFLNVSCFVTVLFVDTHERIGIEVTEGEAALQSESPATTDFIIVTTRLALREVVNRRLELAQAEQSMLLYVDASQAKFTKLLLIND